MYGTYSQRLAALRYVLPVAGCLYEWLESFASDLLQPTAVAHTLTLTLALAPALTLTPTLTLTLTLTLALTLALTPALTPTLMLTYLLRMRPCMVLVRWIRTLRYCITVARPSARSSGGGDLNGLESICTSFTFDSCGGQGSIQRDAGQAAIETAIDTRRELCGRVKISRDVARTTDDRNWYYTVSSYSSVFIFKREAFCLRDCIPVQGRLLTLRCSRGLFLFFFPLLTLPTLEPTLFLAPPQFVFCST